MSYSEEQTRAYSAMMADFNEFEKMKASLSNTKCQIHAKRLKMEAHWENDYDVEIAISKYCCIEFAKKIEKAFVDEKRFTSVVVAKQ